MDTGNKLLRFRWKSAIFFFGFVVGLNLLLVPVLSWFGLSDQLSLFIVNSVGCGVGVSIVMLRLEGKYQSRKQATRYTLGALAVCTALSYYLIYL
ncbi:hypothetical protein [Brevibacillus daliensis]|uniref:hypothetical protein n=1 Tax=Brevibacillus daliensis TaxID=2892995 RepID=UPI001E570834|nr:hypothetical protein [Brevibacillus daliensis]